MQATTPDNTHSTTDTAPGAREALSAEDAQACLDAVARYAQEALQPLWARPERTVPVAECRQALDGLVALGVLTTGSEPGLGLWDGLDAGGSVVHTRLSLGYLTQVGRASGALALQLHTEALARHLDRVAGVDDPDGRPLVVLQGHQGLGREALAAWCSGQALSDEHAAMLADNWCAPQATRPRVLHALPDWTALWCPTWTVAEGWAWQRWPRQACQVAAPERGLGLDELGVQVLQGVQEAPGVQAAHGTATTPTAQLRGQPAQDAWWRLQQAHALGLWAITQAGAQRAAAMAHEQAHLRRQGGAVIAQHAAVQQLLSLAHGTARESAHELHHWAGQALCTAEPGPALRELWRARARHQPRLSQGVSAALQVFGGMGYMQDTGVERWLRQTHHLRLLGGSPAELQACVAWWDTWTELEACA